MSLGSPWSDMPALLPVLERQGRVEICRLFHRLNQKATGISIVYFFATHYSSIFPAMESFTCRSSVFRAIGQWNSHKIHCRHS